MVRRLSPEPIYAIGGGLHFPLTGSRLMVGGVQLQRVVATGKPFWGALTDDDLSRTIEQLNRAGARRLLLSAHDSCDHALERLRREVDAEVDVLRAGATYAL